MGLRATFQSGMQALFTAFGDIPFNITYKVYAAGAVGTRGVPASATYTDKTVQAFVVGYRNEERLQEGGLIAPGDRKVIIEKRVLDALSVTPDKSDRIAIAGDTYKIINISIDPSLNVYFIQVRQI